MTYDCCCAAAFMVCVAGVATPTNAIMDALAMVTGHRPMLSTGSALFLAVAQCLSALAALPKTPCVPSLFEDAGHMTAVLAPLLPGRANNPLGSFPPTPAGGGFGPTTTPTTTLGHATPCAAPIVPSPPGPFSRGIPATPDTGTHPTRDGTDTDQWSLPIAAGSPTFAFVLAQLHDGAPCLAHATERITRNL